MSAPPNTRPLNASEVTPAVTAWAKEMLRDPDLPMGGTAREFVGEGFDLVARAEWHDYYGADANKPKAWHRGVTVYRALAAKPYLSTRFHLRLRALAERLGVDGRWLLAVFVHESGCDPAARNPKSDASGLIQFMPSTIAPWGMTTAQVRTTSAEAQLALVERYYRAAPKCSNIGDCYLVVFWPAAVGKPDDYVIAREGTTAYDWNAPLDVTPADRTLTAGDVRRRFEEHARRPATLAVVAEHEAACRMPYGPAVGEQFAALPTEVKEPPVKKYASREIVPNESEADRFCRQLEAVLVDDGMLEPGTSTKQSTCMVVADAGEWNSRLLPEDGAKVLTERVGTWPDGRPMIIDWGDYAKDMREGENIIDARVTYVARARGAWCGRSDPGYKAGPTRGCTYWIHYPNVRTDTAHVSNCMRVVADTGSPTDRKRGDVLVLDTIQGGQGAPRHVQRYGDSKLVWDGSAWRAGDLGGKTVAGWQVRRTDVVAGKGAWPYPDSTAKVEPAQPPEEKPAEPAHEPDPFPSPKPTPTEDRSSVEEKPPPETVAAVKFFDTPAGRRLFLALLSAAFGGAGVALAFLFDRC